MRHRTTSPASDAAGRVATLSRLADLQRAIASRGQPVESATAIPLRQSVGRVLARPLLRAHGHGVLLDAGTSLRARHVPLIAQEGLETVSVHAPLRVGILTLHDRTREEPDRPEGATPAAVVGALLRGSVEQLGARVKVETGVTDCGHAIAHTLASLHARCELVLVIGFVGPTQAAALATALTARGLDWTSQDLRARPLGALQLGHCAAMPVVALSADLGAAFASFLAFVSPLIRRMQGRNQWLPEVDFGQLQGPMPHSNAWGFFCVTEARGDGVSTQRLQHCKRRDAASAIAEASGLAWRPLDLCLHSEANVAFYPFDRWLR